MKRLSLTVACLASAVAWTQAPAKDLSPRHAAKARHAAAAAKSASLDEVRFSNPYAPPEGATLGKSELASRNGFPVFSYPTPREPKAGLGLTAGDDGLGHYTGGLKWGF
ncbi:MAG TPA: hypothetical protein VN637_04440 [Roseiarcus sp.]|jgi:hypothetical protein|nr:hypothetical protein [Roseiarcus sp.]